MKSINKLSTFFAIFWLAIALLILTAPEMLEARRGSFGGSRSFRSSGSSKRSFGGSRKSYTPSQKPRSNLNRRQSTAPARPATPSQRAASSFGGKRMNTPREYTSKYGTPRRSEAKTITNSQGVSQNYVMHGYGGYGSGLMTGYLLGHTSMMWSLPFHPAFYYSRPYYVDNPDGTVGVYPPTFSWSKLFFTIIIFGVIVYIIYAIVRNKKRNSGGSRSKSSFV